MTKAYAVLPLTGKKQSYRASLSLQSVGDIDTNVVRDVVVENDTRQRDRVLSADERQRLLNACRESHWNRLYLLVLMAMTTGARKGELLKLCWRDIDFKNNSTYLADTKNGEAKELHFPLAVMAELKRLQEVGSGLIFAGGSPSEPMDFRKAWSKALKAADISEKDVLNPDGSVKLEKFTFHCLLHGFCSALSDSGKEINQIAKLAGHKSIQTTMRLFIHQGREQKRQIVNELAQTFSL